MGDLCSTTYEDHLSFGVTVPAHQMWDDDAFGQAGVEEEMAPIKGENWHERENIHKIRTERLNFRC